MQRESEKKKKQLKFNSFFFCSLCSLTLILRNDKHADRFNDGGSWSHHINAYYLYTSAIINVCLRRFIAPHQHNHIHTKCIHRDMNWIFFLQWNIHRTIWKVRAASETENQKISIHTYIVKWFFGWQHLCIDACIIAYVDTIVWLHMHNVCSILSKKKWIKFLWFSGSLYYLPSGHMKKPHHLWQKHWPKCVYKMCFVCDCVW